MLCCKPLLCLAAVSATAVLALAFRPAQDEMDMPKPTAEHQKLMAGAGEWAGTITMFDMPGMEAKPAPATETVTSIGGFWLLSDFHCDFMGMPYHGSGHIGYDAEKKMYVGTWVDSMSSYFSLMEGKYDEAKKAVVMRWKAPDMTGQIVPHREELVENGDTRTMTFYAGEGEGKKTMTIEMKRKGKAATPAGAKK
jgi:hypothetical protein